MCSLLLFADGNNDILKDYNLEGFSGFPDDPQEFNILRYFRDIFSQPIFSSLINFDAKIILHSYCYALFRYFWIS